MSNPRRKATAAIRNQIVEALRDPGRRFLDPKSSSRNYLDFWDLKAVGFYTDLAAGLAASEDLYQKPKNHPNDPQRYQCVLAYPEDDPYPALDIHVTLSPKGQPPRVMVAVHESDTVQTLPRIHPDP
jgi:hypothetical protein